MPPISSLKTRGSTLPGRKVRNIYRRSVWLGLLLLATSVGEQVLANAQRKTVPKLLDAKTTPKPCDIYASAGTPCVAAHSTTRALYADYHGALYQVKRVLDGRTLDIGVIAPPSEDKVAYADAAAQDKFCSSALCIINIIYDQSGKGNHLYQAAPGTFKGPAKGGFDTQPIADMAPVTVNGHKVYGVYIMPGMGLRNNDASYLPTGDEPQGIYYVIDGSHFDSGCCFDYGNASTNGRAVGTGTMDTSYFGNSTVWGKGEGAGPWLMTDMEAGLFSGHSSKENDGDPTINHWRFVTAVVDGGGGNFWDLRGGDAQKGKLATFYSGVRPDPNPSGGYFPMRRQGGILLGTGGDNGNGSSGTFYEGVVTTGRPSETTTDAVQANIIAAHYNVAPVMMTRLKAFTSRSSQQVTVTFTNCEAASVSNLVIRLALPDERWSAASSTSGTSSVRIMKPLGSGASKTVKFTITSPLSSSSGYITAITEWNSAGRIRERESAVQAIRNVPAVKLNEVRFGTTSNPTDQFIELYNASDLPVDISKWSLIHTPSQWASFTLATIPSGTILKPHSFYVLGVAPSGLGAPTAPGATTLNVRSIEGLAAGQTIDIDDEPRRIVSLSSAANAMTTVFTPVSTGARLTIPAGTSNVPVTDAAGFVIGQKIGIDAGGQYEIATVKAVGKAATQTVLSEAASAGANHILIESGINVLSGDTLTLGTGQRNEVVRVREVNVGEKSTDIALSRALKLDHKSGIDVSDRGTGISFSPATKFIHTSGDAVQALGNGIRLDRSLQFAHRYGAPVTSSVASGTGFQGQSPPNLWFGMPLSSSAGSIALMDSSTTRVVDALVYGSRQSNSSANGTITSPELARLEGDQSAGGCIVVIPASLHEPGTSVGRYPDGSDTGSNCADFHTQAAGTILMNSQSGATNIKVSSVDNFRSGQSVLVGSGSSRELATISLVGTGGGTLTIADTPAGATALQVSSTDGFTIGQTISVGSGKEAETATILSLMRKGPKRLVLTAPLLSAHAADTQVSGSGITFSKGLEASHHTGEILESGSPTPGKSNR